MLLQIVVACVTTQMIWNCSSLCLFLHCMFYFHLRKRIISIFKFYGGFYLILHAIHSEHVHHPWKLCHTTTVAKRDMLTLFLMSLLVVINFYFFYKKISFFWVQTYFIFGVPWHFLMLYNHFLLLLLSSLPNVIMALLNIFGHCFPWCCPTFFSIVL